ncbi:hypothetical protein P7C70_g272, partial [Phenoliferia sp. Uapishka_3]
MGDQKPTTRLSYGPFCAWVCVNGETTPLYSLTTKENTTTCYIQAEEDAPYSVHLLDDQEEPTHGLASRLWIDGTKRTASIVGQDDVGYEQMKGSMLRIESFTGTRSSATSEKPFAFGKLLLTDDVDLACSDEHIVKGLGKIQLKLYRVSNVVSGTWSAVDKDALDTNPVITHEKIKKATLSHQTEYGKEVATTSGHGVASYDPIDTDPYHIFEFRYLCRDLLELGGHIPGSHHRRTPSHARQLNPLPQPTEPAKLPTPAPESSGSRGKRKSDVLANNDDSDGDISFQESVDQEIARHKARIEQLQDEEIARHKAKIAHLEGLKGNGAKRVKKEDGVKKEGSSSG